MDYITLKNTVFSKYYFNSYLPGTLGAFEIWTMDRHNTYMVYRSTASIIFCS